MIKRIDISIKTLNDYDKLNNVILPSLIDDNLIREIKLHIGMACKTVTYEYPYYDRDYLSTFYNFYATKLREYSKKCARLIFWADKDEILGYITLRPTPVGTKIGKTYLEPHKIIKSLNSNGGTGRSYNIILSNHKAHILDKEIFLQCFPWMEQQQDITVCAHIAIWSVLRHFSAKSSIYNELLSGEIADKVEHYARKIPSPGLTPPQMSSIFMQSGFSTMVHYSRKFETFFNEMIAYLDSGIPYVGVLSKYEHAVSVIGYVIDKKRIIEKLSDKNERFIEQPFSNKTKEPKITLHSSLVEGLIVNDDQCFPYKVVEKYSSFINSQNQMEHKDGGYFPQDIDCIIVPFYKRIQLSYSEVYHMFMALNGDVSFQWVSKECVNENIYVRVFLAAANTFKEYISEVWNNESGDCNAMSTLIAMELPRYIWCVEISSKISYINNKVDSLVLVDSTSSAIDGACLFVRDKVKYRYLSDNTLSQSSVFQVFFKDKNGKAFEPDPWECYSRNYERI